MTNYNEIRYTPIAIVHDKNCRLETKKKKKESQDLQQRTNKRVAKGRELTQKEELYDKNKPGSVHPSLLTSSFTTANGSFEPKPKKSLSILDLQSPTKTKFKSKPTSNPQPISNFLHPPNAPSSHELRERSKAKGFQLQKRQRKRERNYLFM